MSTYYELLQNKEWKLKREEILIRDNNKCDICSNKTLINNFRISYCAYGTLSSGRLIILVYDKQSKSLNRCNTDLNQEQFKSIIDQYGENSIICLSHGEGVFCHNVGIIITNNFLSYPGIENRTRENIKKFGIEQQIIQEQYLKNLPVEQFKELRWINTRHLHIHHKYYSLNKSPWEYPNDAFQTLCWQCHEELHKNSLIPVFNSNLELVGNYETCSKCYGAGYLPHFSHVQSGVCFQCNGKRYMI